MQNFTSCSGPPKHNHHSQNHGSQPCLKCVGLCSLLGTVLSFIFPHTFEGSALFYQWGHWHIRKVNSLSRRVTELASCPWGPACPPYAVLAFQVQRGRQGKEGGRWPPAILLALFFWFQLIKNYKEHMFTEIWQYCLEWKGIIFPSLHLHFSSLCVGA